MPLLLVLLLVAVPVAELWLIVQVGQGIGVLPTLVLLVAISIGGAALLRREGARAWGAFRSAMAAGRVPAKEVADGALVVLGGALLLTPGFLTDAVGLLCVLPPSRAVLRRAVTGLVARRLDPFGIVRGVAGTRRARPGRPGPGSVVDGDVVPGEVVEGEVVEDEPGDGPPAAGR